MQAQLRQPQVKGHKRAWQSVYCPANVHYRPFTAARGPCTERRAVAARSSTSEQQSTPAATRGAGRMTYRPETYQEMVGDASVALLEAMKDGYTRLEVEFPPIPTRIDAYKGSSDLFIDSNVQLALAAAKEIAAAGKKVHILLPDQAEYNRSYKIFKPSLDLLDSISFGHVKEFIGDPIGNLKSLFYRAPDSTAAASAADVYIFTCITTIELPGVRAYIDANVGSKVAVAWNLELDTLRADLGLPGWPPKELHLTWLSTFKPAFYLRPRDYSKSVSVAPFIINYSGALLREYPGPWQVMLKQDNGQYACIAEDSARYNLGDVKEEMMAAMALNTEEEGSVAAFLRRGYKTSTWWEDAAGTEASDNWRT